MRQALTQQKTPKQQQQQPLQQLPKEELALEEEKKEQQQQPETVQPKNAEAELEPERENKEEEQPETKTDENELTNRLQSINPIFFRLPYEQMGKHMGITEEEYYTKYYQGPNLQSQGRGRILSRGRGRHTGESRTENRPGKVIRGAQEKVSSAFKNQVHLPTSSLRV